MDSRLDVYRLCVPKTPASFGHGGADRDAPRRDDCTYLSKLVPDGEERVDFYHAVEQLKAALDAAYGETSAEGQAQFNKHRHVLREDFDGVEKVIRALSILRSKHPRHKRIGEVLGYFRRHRHRMDYAEAAMCAFPIGSGVVEAACKTLTTQRMKRSGMRWRHEGGQAILTLRSLLQSHRFEHAWSLLSATYRAEVLVSPNDPKQMHWKGEIKAGWALIAGILCLPQSRKTRRRRTTSREAKELGNNKLLKSSWGNRVGSSRRETCLFGFELSRVLRRSP